MVGFITCSVLVSRAMAKKLKAVMDVVQAHLTTCQEDAYKLINRFQAKPMGSQKLMQDRIEQVMEKGVREALGLLDQAKPLYRWNILAERQINTVRFQLLYQIKEFEPADALLSKILVMEPITLAMKLARLYKTNDPSLEKVFRKGVRKFKSDKAALIYSLYAWILLQQDRHDDALAVLEEGKTKTEDETLVRNWQAVANKRYGQFSNAGLGDQWYALHLEKPTKPRAGGKGQLKNNPMIPKARKRF